MGMRTVVIGHRQMAQATSARLLNQLNRVEAAIAAEGMAVKITDIGTAFWPDGLEDLPKRM